MVKLVGMIRRRPDLPYEEFTDHWLRVHAKIAARLPGLRRYSINFIDRNRFPNSVYDGFSELWFDSQEALDAAFAGPIGEAIGADIPAFMSELVRVIVDERVILEPAGPA